MMDGTHGETEAEGWSRYPAHSIAIVGMAGRFPGADSVDELWELLVEGKTTVEPAPVERFQLPQTGNYVNTKWWGNFLRDPDAFDHRFFKKSSREAIASDPQQRILHEVVYEALESTGYFGSLSTEPDDYGCYIGAVMNNYYDNLSCHPPTAYGMLGTARAFFSGSVSHYFGWTGPAVTMDTACSSSLVAIDAACQAILTGRCSRAVAGGTNVISSPIDYQNLHAAGFLSPSGQCKPFDAAADGYCRGEGVAVVVLKPLSDAIKENDNILGVIIGSAISQIHNVSHVTVPQSSSQVELYRKVMKLSGVDPGLVSYVEAHGTGTRVGDPVEARSIRDAFGGSQRCSTLYFGSIKGNIGHTESTAGVAGLVKVLLMMRHGKIPAQASYNTINPKIPAFDCDQMAIPRNILPWNPSFRVACVNSYGAAGSNSVVMVCEKPFSGSQTTAVPLSKYPVLISAGSESGLAMYCKKLLGWLKKSKTENPDLITSLSFNLANRANHTLPHVLATTVSSIQDLESKLETPKFCSRMGPVQAPKPVVLVFGGQESDFIGLSEAVYRSSKVFRDHLDSCDKFLVSNGRESFYPFIFQREPIQNLTTLHSALFAVQYASAKAWMDCGLSVSAVVGHSFGQLTALCISGVLSLADALTLVSERASIMATHWGPEPGSMIFLQTDRHTVHDILGSLRAQDDNHYAEVACYNGPKSHVVVGSCRSIDSLGQYVAATPSLRDSVRCKRLRVTHGFHSRYCEPILPHLHSLAEKLVWRRPSLHIETCDDKESITEPTFGIIQEHTRSPVFFQQAIERLTKRFSQCTWIEAGRASSIIQFVKESVADAQGHIFLSPHLASPNAQASLTDTTVDLWKAGYATQYWPFHRSQKSEYEYLSLPPYQFEKTRHWLPFTGRGVEKEQLRVEKMPQSCELVSFLQFKDSTKQEAIFRIDPQADRFKALLGGHTMSGQALAPASLYLEVVACAALFLQQDSEARTYVPTVDDLVMKSPIGSDVTKEIILTLKQVKDMCSSWLFSLSTQTTVGNVSEPFEHSTGKVCLKKRDNVQSARDFRRFESLIGYRRCEKILNHPEAESMQGNHIYRAFDSIVHYGEAFRGIKKIACIRTEAAGKVTITPGTSAPADQRLCDTPMTDSFMQSAGFLVNYFNNQKMDDVLVCMKIEHIEIGGDFNPDAKEWVVYSNMGDGGDSDAWSDAYVFEAGSKKLVMVALGFRFSRTPRASLGRILKSVNQSGTSSSTPVKREAHAADNLPALKAPEEPHRKRHELFQVLSNVTDIPIGELRDDSTLEELGIDSLMATEVLNDIRSALGLTIDLTTFLFFPDVQSLAAHIDEKLGIGGEDSSRVAGIKAPPLPSARSSTELPETPMPLEKPLAVIPESHRAVEKVANLSSAFDAFQETRFRYDQLAEGAKALKFWSQAYPSQARLVLAYVVEAFSELGCDLKALQPGDTVPQVQALDKHEQLVRQFCHILEDGKLISSSRGCFNRTSTPVDPTPAESIYQQIIDLYPQHADVNKLIRSVGSRAAACLVGDADVIQIVFGNKETKKALEDMYEFWPLLRTPTLLLGEFLLKAFTNATVDGKFRLLEIGAGTGGTTRYIINHLRSHGIQFEYVFTDISASLVAAARNQFKGVDGMSFEVLDIERPPKPEHKGKFHCVIATNCIHATRDLNVSLLNLRQMLREDGALTLVEVTRRMFWYDVVFGFFEGWWLFEDGRSHAVVDEKHWERLMRGAGFKEVLWTDGATPESKTVRVIGAFPSAPKVALPSINNSKKTVKVALETVVYKKIGDREVHADIYYPVDRELPGRKMPVGKSVSLLTQLRH